MSNAENINITPTEKSKSIAEYPLWSKQPKRRLLFILKDGSITWNKLSKEVKDRIFGNSGGTADVTEEIYNEIDELRNRIEALENKKPEEPEKEKHYETKLTFSNSIVEYPAGVSGVNVTLNFTIQLNESGNVLNSNYTDIKTIYTVTGDSSQHTSTNNPYSGTITFSNPSTKTVTASGTATYKNNAVTFPSASQSVSAVIASYIGYTEKDDATSIAGVIAGTNSKGNKTKIVKKNLSGTYSVGFSFSDTAYLYIAIPKNGNVDTVNTVLQHSVIDVEQKMNSKEVTANNQTYTVLTSKVAHRAGTYQFILR